MKREKKTMISLVLAAAIMIGCLSGCGQNAPAASAVPAAPVASAAPADSNVPEAEEPVKISTRINLGTAGNGSLFHSAGVALTQLWIEKFDGCMASAATTSGSKENLQMLATGEVNIGFIQSDILINSYNGVKEFEGKGVSNLRILAPVTTNPYHLLTREGANINTIQDVKGKQVVVGPAGAGLFNQTNAVFNPFGITMDDIGVNNLGQADGIEAMRNGLVDFTIVVGQYPFGVIVEALTNDSLRLIGMSEEEVNTILAANDWMTSSTIPANTYTGQTEALNTVAHNGFICVNADFPEEDAYNLVKAIFTNQDWLVNAFSSFDSWAFNNPGDAATETGVPLHPGAERALKELGML